jgi:hypothetical protein
MVGSKLYVITEFYCTSKVDSANLENLGGRDTKVSILSKNVDEACY